MANLRYITPNQLRLRARRARTIVMALGLPVAIALSFVHPLLTLATAITLVVFWDKQVRLIKGAEGEDRALGIPTAFPGSLSSLTDEYMIFNQVRIPWRDTLVELDYIVVGPNGVFNIECKHLVGDIIGSDTDRKWVQRKRKAGGGFVTREARNPVSQVRRSTYALATYLRSKGINVWVEAVVVFTHPAARLSVNTNSVSILTLLQLAQHVKNYRPLIPFRQQGAAMRAIKFLLDEKSRTISMRANKDTSSTELKNGSSGLRHIGCFMRDFVPERVEGFMNHDLRKVIKDKSPESNLIVDATSDLLTPFKLEPRSARNVQSKSTRRPGLTVIRGGATGTTASRTTVRTYFKCVEIVKVEETSGGEF